MFIETDSHMPSADPFFQYAVTTHSTSEGGFDLPMFFYKLQNCFALFFTDIESARAICRPENLEPVEFGKGQALVAMASFNYIKCSVDPYHEVGLAIAAVPKGAEAPADPMAALLGDSDLSHMGFYVVDLPVTTKQANAGGIELWGFPKFVADIKIALDGDDFDSATTDPGTGDPIYTLSGTAGVGATLPALSFVYFTRMNGKTLRIHGVARGAAKFALGGSFRLNVSENSTHRMAKNLRALGLDGAAPVAVILCAEGQMRLTEGAPVP